MTYEEIKALLINKKPDIDQETLNYFTNYFYVATKKGVIPSEVGIENLIDNALTFASKIVFYDENHYIYKKHGGDVKGYRDPETKTIFIRNNLKEPLREMVVYHELHHAVQTNPLNNEVGINQVSNIGRLIMEAQTEYFAEEVYKEIHGVSYDEREIPSESLRMAKGGTVVSALHNYEMYDNLMTKIGLILGVPKLFFVSINYLFKDNLGLKILEEKYEEAKNKYQLPLDFQTFLLFFDYAYCVDLMAYTDNPDKEKILNGGTTDAYEIYPNKGFQLSLANQMANITKIDIDCFLKLAENGGNFKEFARYIISDEKRAIAMEYIASFDEPTPPSGPKRA